MWYNRDIPGVFIKRNHLMRNLNTEIVFDPPNKELIAARLPGSLLREVKKWGSQYKEFYKNGRLVLSWVIWALLDIGLKASKEDGFEF